MVPAAGQLAQKAWEVGVVRGEVVGARVQHPNQVAPVEILTTQAIGPVNIAHLQISSRPPSARCATNAGEPCPLQIEAPGCGDFGSVSWAGWL